MSKLINLKHKRKGKKMANSKLIAFVLVVAFCLLAVNCFAGGGHGHKNPKKVGILLVAFGSSEASAQISFENIDRKVKAAYPGIEVRWHKCQGFAISVD